MSAAVVMPSLEAEIVEEESSTALTLVRPPRFDFSPIVEFVLDSVSSPLTKRAYGACLRDFINWFAEQWGGEFSRACIQRYKSTLEARGLSSSSVNKALAAIRKLASEARYNGFLSADIATGIADVKGAKRQGVRMGNWLSPDQAQTLLDLPDPATLAGKRDRALLAVMLGGGLRRSELANLTVEHIQQRDGRWVIVDLVGKHGRVRSVPIAAGVKARIDIWIAAAGFESGRVFRSINKGDHLVSDALSDQAVYGCLSKYAELLGVKLAPHDARRTFAKLSRKGGADIQQIQFVLGHSSVSTTERYLGMELDLTDSPSDHIKLKF